MKAKTKHNFANRGFLTFKNVTLVPYQRRMIDPKMLSSNDVAYLVSVDDNNVLLAAGSSEGQRIRCEAVGNSLLLEKNPTVSSTFWFLVLFPKKYPDAAVFQNEYNDECREKVGSLLRELGHKDALQWLLRETEPIG